MSASTAHPLARVLSGVTAERGSLVACRDEPSFEIVMRMNRESDGKLISAVFRDVRGSTSQKLPLLFVAGDRRVEEKIQDWMDPFKRTENSSLTNDRRRQRDDDVSSTDESGEDTDDD